MEVKVDFKQLCGLVKERNDLMAVCKRALDTLNSVACTDTDIDEMVRDDIKELERVIEKYKEA